MILKIDAPLAATNVRKPAQGMAWRVPALDSEFWTPIECCGKA
jgi:hypothetical protein